MKSVRLTLLLTCITLVFAGSPCFGVLINFQLYPTGNNNQLVASQLTLDVSAFGTSQALFRLSNTGPIASTISDVLFYDGALLGISALRDNNDQIAGQLGLAGVGFTKGVPFRPDSLPRYPTATYGADRDSRGGVANGVDNGEWLEILFDLKPGMSFQDLLNGLASGQVFAGLHVQGIGSTGGSDWYKSDPISMDSPTSVPDGALTILLLGAALISIEAFRRRSLRNELMTHPSRIRSE